MASSLSTSSRRVRKQRTSFSAPVFSWNTWTTTPNQSRPNSSRSSTKKKQHSKQSHRRRRRRCHRRRRRRSHRRRRRRFHQRRRLLPLPCRASGAGRPPVSTVTAWRSARPSWKCTRLGSLWCSEPSRGALSASKSACTMGRTSTWAGRAPSNVSAPSANQTTTTGCCTARKGTARSCRTEQTRSFFILFWFHLLFLVIVLFMLFSDWANVSRRARCAARRRVVEIVQCFVVADGPKNVKFVPRIDGNVEPKNGQLTKSHRQIKTFVLLFRKLVSSVSFSPFRV